MCIIGAAMFMSYSTFNSVEAQIVHKISICEENVYEIRIDVYVGLGYIFRMKGKSINRNRFERRNSATATMTIVRAREPFEWNCCWANVCSFFRCRFPFYYIALELMKICVLGSYCFFFFIMNFVFVTEMQKCICHYVFILSTSFPIMHIYTDDSPTTTSVARARETRRMIERERNEDSEIYSVILYSKLSSGKKKCSRTL